MTIRNGELYLVYMKTYDVVSVFENICDYYYMNELISEESLNLGLLRFFETVLEDGDI